MLCPCFSWSRGAAAAQEEEGEDKKHKKKFKKKKNSPVMAVTERITESFLNELQIMEREWRNVLTDGSWP